jgi:nicotinamide mononucleotide transporter
MMVFSTAVLVDFFGSIFSYSSAAAFSRIKSYGWLIGLLAIFTNSFFYYHNQFYANLLIQSVHLFFCFYGLRTWLRSERKVNTVIIDTEVDAATLLKWLCIWLPMYASLAMILCFYTPSPHPLSESFGASCFLFAQYLSANRHICNWYGWLIGDIIYLVLYWHHNTPFHFILNLAYFPLIFYGYRNWIRESSLQKAKGLCFT